MKKIYLIGFLFAMSLYGALAQDLSSIKIYINPGHGGHDADDRNVVIPPFSSGDPNGFWESNSNLDKGLMLRDMLEARGAKTVMSRVTNTTADDLGLSTIVRLANESEADFFFSIHSNASDRRSNFPLMLFRGYTDQPEHPEAKRMAQVLGTNLYSNKATAWSTTDYQLAGDWTFQPSWGTQGYGVLRGLTVNGMLSEGSFHDYIPETYRLMNMDYKRLEAWHFMKSIIQFFDLTPIPTGNVAGFVKDSRNTSNTANFPIKGTTDILLALHNAKVTLTPGDKVITTDELYNGVFGYFDLEPGEYTVKAEAEGYYPQTYPLTVRANETTYIHCLLNKVRNTPPEVTDYSPKTESLTDSVECSAQITMDFNWDMDEESTRAAFSIEPSVEGELTFEDSQYRLRFTPSKPMEPGTVYTVKLAKSAKHPDNIAMLEDFSFQFITKNRNRLKLLAAYPYDGSQGVYTTPQFRFIFDGKLETSNLMDEIKIYDASGAEQTISSRSTSNNRANDPYGSFYFSLTTALTPGQNYRVVLGGAIADNKAIPLVDPVEINFRVSEVKVSDQPLVLDFETAGQITYQADRSVGVKSAASSRSTSQKLFGAASYKFTSTFNAPDGYAVYTFAEPSVKTVAGKVLGAHIYGDLSGNDLQLELTSGEDVRYITLTRMNFAGWEFREVVLTELPSEKEYALTGIRIVENNQRLVNGEVYLDNMLMYDDPISGLDMVQTGEELKVYPNPVSDMVRVSGATGTCVLELYSFGGALLSRVSGTEMNISGFAPGTYILHIVTADQTKAMPLIIVR